MGQQWAAHSSSVQGQAPGYVFRSESGQPVELEDWFDAFDARQNPLHGRFADGQTVYSANLDEFKAAAGESYRRSNSPKAAWFLVRAITENKRDLSLRRNGALLRGNGTDRASAVRARSFSWIGPISGATKLPRRRLTSRADGAGQSAELTDALQAVESAKAYWKRILDHANAE